MEKYLRLLNPKTTNYESTGGGSYGALTAQDVCVAMSYAKLTVVQSHLINLHALTHNTIDQIKSSTKVIQKELSQSNSGSNANHEISIFIALVELCKVPADYKPSLRNRGVIGGVSKDRVQRHLNDLINEYKKFFKNEIDKAFGSIKQNICSDSN